MQTDRKLREARKLGNNDLIFVPYYQVVINPTDFAQTVENIFYVSFLIRDGFCAIENRNGEPCIGEERK